MLGLFDILRNFVCKINDYENRNEFKKISYGR